MLYRKPPVDEFKPYAVNETKKALKEKIDRIWRRLKAIESHYHRRSFLLQKRLKDWLKSPHYKKSVYDKRFYFFAVVEVKEVLTEEKPISYGNNEWNQILIVEDKKTFKTYFNSADVPEQDKKKVRSIWCKTYYNCVNVFLSRESALEDLELNKDKYYKPKVISMFPLQNQEFADLKQHIMKLGEVLPDSMSIFEEVEQLRKGRKVLEKTVETQTSKVIKLKNEFEDLQEENNNLKSSLEAIATKKGKKK